MKTPAMAVLFVVALLVPEGARATCTSTQCSAAGSGNRYVDYTCPSSATCNAPSSGCDACPGHCNVVPAVACVDNTPCTGGGGDYCNFSTTTYFGTCSSNSGSLAGQACASNANCDPDSRKS